MTDLKIFINTLILLLVAMTSIHSQSAEDRLIELGIELAPVSPPIANYVKYRQVGDLLFLAGHVPTVKGKIGQDLTLEQGYAAARETAIALLSTISSAIGDLDKVSQFVKVEGMVNCTDDFYDQSKVINGCSDLLVEIFGERGKHARTAVGHNSLPGNYAVEISAILQIVE